MSEPTAAGSIVNRRTRPLAKTRVVSARLTENEYTALENHAWASGKTVGDWARESLLHGLEIGSPHRIENLLFTELVAVQLLLMNTLGPLLRGEQMTPEQLDGVLKQVQSVKARKAQELLIRRLTVEDRRV